ncbi:MAG TPA: hypothetical protein VJ967_09475 [Clostridia bacterium]|nr:hypothetical protein [Clostridia bacterium]
MSWIAFRLEQGRDEYVGIEGYGHECSLRDRSISPWISDSERPAVPRHIDVYSKSLLPWKIVTISVRVSPDLYTIL